RPDGRLARGGDTLPRRSPTRRRSPERPATVARASSSFPLPVDDLDHRRDRQRLAREHPALGHLVVLEDVVHTHLDCALDHARHARRAVPGLTRRRWPQSCRARREQERRARLVNGRHRVAVKGDGELDLVGEFVRPRVHGTGSTVRKKMAFPESITSGWPHMSTANDTWISEYTRCSRLRSASGRSSSGNWSRWSIISRR